MACRVFIWVVGANESVGEQGFKALGHGLFESGQCKKQPPEQRRDNVDYERKGIWYGEG